MNIGELLAVATLGALALEPLLGSLAAGSFLLFGLLLLAFCLLQQVLTGRKRA